MVSRIGKSPVCLSGSPLGPRKEASDWLTRKASQNRFQADILQCSSLLIAQFQVYVDSEGKTPVAAAMMGSPEMVFVILDTQETSLVQIAGSKMGAEVNLYLHNILEWFGHGALRSGHCLVPSAASPSHIVVECGLGVMILRGQALSKT